MRVELIEKDGLKALNESLNKSLDLAIKQRDYTEDQKNILLERNDDLSKTLQESKSLTDWQKIGYFALGVLSISVGLYAAKKINN